MKMNIVAGNIPIELKRVRARIERQYEPRLLACPRDEQQRLRDEMEKVIERESLRHVERKRRLARWAKVIR